MTDNEINIAIATVYPHDEPVTMHKAPLVNYAGSLDAMHEAERVLFADIKNYEPYRQQLLRICLRPVHATARQRAEAFLRVKGAWVE